MVAVLVSKFDDFECIFSILQFCKGTDPMPLTARKETDCVCQKDFELKAIPVCCVAASSV
jgi:hypothetical protein